MKRNKSILISLLIGLVSCTSNAPSGQSPSSQSKDKSRANFGDYLLTYYPDMGGYFVDDYFGDENSITIPDEATVDNFKAPIVGVSDGAFSYRKGTESIKLGNNLYYLGEYAFANSDVKWLLPTANLVHVPKTALEGSKVTFNKHEGVNYLSVGSTLCSIAVFPDEYKENQVLANSCETIVDNCFGPNSVNLKFTKNLKNIGDGNYIWDYSAISTSALDASFDIYYAGKNALQKFEKVNKLYLKGEICPYIGEAAFAGALDLERASFFSPLSRIGKAAFKDCLKLDYVADVGESITEIGESAFEGCSSLTAVSINKKLAKIGEKAFAGCSSLKSIILPLTLETIGKDAFKDCTGLTNIYCAAKSKPEGWQCQFPEGANITWNYKV